MTKLQLHEAFELLNAVGRPRDARRVVVTRFEPMSTTDLAAAEALLGWALPPDYQAALSGFGPFKLSEVDNISEGGLLAPHGGRTWLPKMKEVLSKWAKRSGPETDVSDLDDIPVDDLLPVAWTYDRDGRHSWLFYHRDESLLFKLHEKHGLDVTTVELETRLVDLVCHFAEWDRSNAVWLKYE